jgi:UDP-glucose 6-dehydrogenase
MIAREKQCEFLADTIIEVSKKMNMPVCLLGKAFKPNTGITTGSSAVLLSAILEERGVFHTIHDPLLTNTHPLPSTPHVFFVSCAHNVFHTYVLPDGSVCIDPHRLYESLCTNYIALGCGM